MARHGTRLAVWGGGTLSRAGAEIGRWLRARHDATRTPAAPFQGDRLLRQIHERLDEATDLGLPEEAANQIRQQAGHAAARLARVRIPHAARQGLLGAGPMWADGPTVRIAGIDSLGESDAVYQDVASFSASLRVRSVGALYSRARLASMRRSFLWAYGQADTDPVLALYELRHVLAALAASTGRGSIPSWWRRQGLAREATELAGRLAVVRHHPASDRFRTMGALAGQRLPPAASRRPAEDGG